MKLTRREAWWKAAGAAAASAQWANGQTVPPAPALRGEPDGRVPPVEEVINAFEMETLARRKLGNTVFAGVAGSERAAFERITFRPRLMVNAMDLDLSQQLLGAAMFAPVIVGPVAQLQRYHAEGEVAMARGAAGAKAAMVVSGRSSVALEKIAAAAASAEGNGLLWYQVFAADAAEQAVEGVAKLRAKAVVLTLGGAGSGDWGVVDRLRKALSGAARVPLVVKGIMSAVEARAALEHGAEAIVLSNYREGDTGGAAGAALASPLEVLPAVADAVAGKAPILIDGSFRRGSDLLKALALGARAVMVARPMVWALAAYGAPGVKHLLETLQTELARDMAMCGKPSLQLVDRATVRIHSR